MNNLTIPSDGALYASQLIAILVDEMASVGDFKINSDFWKNRLGQPDDVVSTDPPEQDPVEKAFSQGEKVATEYPEVTEDMNPYPPGSGEFSAWLEGFKAVKGGAE